MVALHTRRAKLAHNHDTGTADILAGLAAGIIGGLAGAWTMNQYHSLIAKAQKHGDQEEDGAGDQGGREDANLNIGGEDHDQEPATEKAATAIITGAFGQHLSKHQKKAAGNITHYAFGASVGGLYGTLAEAAPPVRSGLGLPWGALVWLIADEAAVPALGLAKPPHKHPPSTHINALAAHLVYGVTLELVRRLIRRII